MTPKTFLDKQYLHFNQPSFIPTDPISVPHRFSKKQDIEIAGLFAAIFAWGNRTTIIAKANELMGKMGNQPHAFILHHSENDLRSLLDFKHRTFNATDLLYFIAFLHHHYTHYSSLEDAFQPALLNNEPTIEKGLDAFYQHFFSLEDAPARTRKHIAAPSKGSTCKRLNMYLRWMVRKDKMGVDFGLWQRISPAQLICPIDLHVARVARQMGLLKRKQTDWLAALELTEKLRSFDKTDPVKYDFALFGLGVLGDR